jgi:peptide/nickel transport system permease protein
MIASSDAVPAPTSRSPLKRFRMGRRWFLLIPLSIITVMITTAVLAEFLTPYSSTEISLANRLRPPFWGKGGNLSYPLGTDPMGCDLLTCMIYGTRVFLVVAMLALLVGGGIGAALGLMAGYYGGRLDALVMRVADTTMAFPIILFAILFVVVLGGSMVTTAFAVALVLWARYARVIRGEVLSLRERDFVAQARVAGCSSSRIMLIHLFPNILNTLVVLLSLQVGWVIIVEASLSFLGAGIPPPTPTWGSMIAEGRDYIATAWWVSFFPGVAILATVLSFNLFGDWLRDALDPKLRQI